MLVGHQKQWEFLKRKLEAGSLSHAYLFAGENQIGKKTFAKEFIKFINCSFPDFLMVKAENGGEIQISKIREVQNFLSYKPYYGSFKCVIIDEAERMNQEAQSCFLKTLEEPKGNTILFLISSHPEMLLPTIFSRCQILKFFRPKDLPQNQEKLEKDRKIFEELLSVLNLDFSDKFKYVKSIDFGEQRLGEILEVLQRYLRYLLFVKTGAGKTNEQKYFFGISSVLEKYPVFKLKKIIKLTEDISFKTATSNASPKLALELLMLEI